jgi:hypothetical protein
LGTGVIGLVAVVAQQVGLLSALPGSILTDEDTSLAHDGGPGRRRFPEFLHLEFGDTNQGVVPNVPAH